MSTLWRRDRSSSLGALVCLAACAMACLPRGDPPAGRQVVADRASFLTGVVPPTSDGILRLLVTRVSPGGGNDLYVLSVPDTGPPSERLLAANLPPGAPCPPRDSGWINGPCYPTDARGRLYLFTSLDVYQATWGIARFDPVTGERLDLGSGSYFVLSPARERVLVMSFSNATIYESDDRATQIADGSNTAGFVGEDLFYVVPEQGLMHLPPHGVPELLRAGITGFQEQPTQTGPVLILFTPGADPNLATNSVLDPVTLEELFRPIEIEQFTSVDVSPDRRWLLVDDSNARRLTFIDGVTGALDEEGPLDSGTRFSHEWRPGHAEVWYEVSASEPDGRPSPLTWIKAPGKPAITVPLYAEALYGSIEARGLQSFFTRDGAYWFSFSYSLPGEQRTGIQIGPADDPAGVRFEFTPRGTSNFGYTWLADGRLLVAAYYTDFQRSDISAVDPATGARQLLGEQGTVLVVGERRLLANLHMIDGYGDLTAIDVADAHATLLAPEFAYTAFVEPQAGDPDAAKPGARVAFQFRARFDSPYDGIWVTALP